MELLHRWHRSVIRTVTRCLPFFVPRRYEYLNGRGKYGRKSWTPFHLTDLMISSTLPETRRWSKRERNCRPVNFRRCGCRRVVGWVVGCCCHCSGFNRTFTGQTKTVKKPCNLGTIMKIILRHTWLLLLFDKKNGPTSIIHCYGG